MKEEKFLINMPDLYFVVSWCVLAGLFAILSILRLEVLVTMLACMLPWSQRFSFFFLLLKKRKKTSGPRVASEVYN